MVDGVNNTITTGGANAVVLNGADGTVKTGTVTVTGGTTNDITGLSNTTVNSADFATKGRAAYGRTIETGRGTNMAKSRQIKILLHLVPKQVLRRMLRLVKTTKFN